MTKHYYNIICNLQIEMKYSYLLVFILSLIYFNHDETQMMWGTKLLCILNSVMFKTWAS